MEFCRPESNSHQFMLQSFIDNFASSISDHWFAKCVHATAHIGRVPRCLSRHGAHGCEPVPGHPDGSRSRANVIFALSDAVRYQTLTFSRNHS